jgi:hypothetical protein
MDSLPTISSSPRPLTAARQVKFYIPFEEICPGALALPSPDLVGAIQAQDLLLCAYLPPEYAPRRRYWSSTS